MKVITVTGYKPHEMGVFGSNHPAVVLMKKALKQRIGALCETGLEWVVVSGQKGVELWAAQVVLELRETYEVKLAILTPFLHQEEKWKEHDQILYNEVVSSADFVETISKKGYESPEQFRTKDAILLHKTDGAVILYDEELVASPQYFIQKCLAYAKQHEYIIDQITFEDLQLIQEDSWVD